MGLFGPKIQKEEKMYQKVLKNTLSKPNTKNVNEMKGVLTSYPAGWQGYWICGIYHDQGFDGSERDGKKAQEYFEKAEAAVKGKEHEVWLREFMTWYRRDAGNLDKPISEELERARRLGIAMCYSNLLGDNYLTAPYEKYCGDGYVMSWGILSKCNVDSGEIEAFCDFLGVNTFDRNGQIKDTNKYLEKSEKAANVFSKCIHNVIDGREPRWDKYFDMYTYLLSINCIHGGNLLTAEVAAVSNETETFMGVNNLINSTYGGCQPAIHELVRLANASQNNFNMMQDVYESRSGRRNGKEWRDFKGFLIDNLKKCIEKNDAEAKRLYQMYYEGC